MNKGDPRNTKMNHSQGLRSQMCREPLPTATAVASRNPVISAMIPKYRFQIIPDPIRVNCWHKVKSVDGNSFSPYPSERSQ